MSHPFSKVDAMKQHNRVPAATSHETRGRVEAATIAAVSNPCRLVGDGASRDQLGQVAEILRRIEAQMSSLKCDLAGRLQRTDGGAGAGEVLRDQLGMTNHGPSLPTPGEEMSHPFSNVEAMKQHNHIPAPTAPQEICGWAEAANAAAVAGLRRLVGDGASREQLGRAAETLRRMEAQMSSLKCDLAGRLQRTDGGAGAGEVLRD